MPKGGKRANSPIGIVKHGHCYRGNMTAEYQCWAGIKKRCLNPAAVGYENYGGRGIKISDRWLNSFENFIADMGPKPTPSHSIDRIDNDGDYEPSNCRWATRKEQVANQRTRFTARLIEIDGVSKPAGTWAREAGLRRDTFYNRLNSGWPIEKLFTTPDRGKGVYER
jgi:hypothetical protein